MQLAQDETIVAISTPPGAGGIGIIRVSGRQSLPLLQHLFIPNAPGCAYRSHRLYYGHIKHPQSKKIVDEVLAVYMAAPRTYTREDVVEIHCHGSFLVLQNVLELLLEHGTRLAEPGEFTKRAFLNGRIDLTQAEAVIDVLAAKTRKGVDIAQEQLSGALYNRIDPIRQSLVHMRAFIEVAIDFPDEDIEILDHSKLIVDHQREVVTPLGRLLKNSESGRLYREGISLVIAGLPNVGKSSLLNTILQEDRALVTSVAGTTRDSIEEVVDIHGLPVRIIDTAGIREHADEVEELGIKRAKELINKADLVLFMIDASRDVTDEDSKLYESVKHKPVVAVLNKTDIAMKPTFDFSAFGEVASWVEISAKDQTGVAELKQAIFDSATGSSEQWEEGGCAPNFRHKQALALAYEASNRVLSSLEKGFTNDLIAVDLQECLEQLSGIVGETTTEDILDVIFEQFCLGK